MKLIARFGAGYDTIDLAACTRAGVVVTNTPLAVRKPLAVAALTLVLALSHHLLAKDRLARTSNWRDRENFRGEALDEATLGIVGFGGVGSELARIAAPLGLRIIGHNRSGRHAAAAGLGVELVGLDELLSRSDYVVVCAALTPQTENLINADRLALMKPSAYLVNIGRGKLVDTEALRAALRQQRVAGAGLDVFEPEPLSSDDELLRMDNVVLAPHSLCWTADFTRDVSASAVRAIIDVAQGRRPEHVLNPAVYDAAPATARSTAGWRR